MPWCCPCAGSAPRSGRAYDDLTFGRWEEILHDNSPFRRLNSDLSGTSDPSALSSLGGRAFALLPISLRRLLIAAAGLGLPRRRLGNDPGLGHGRDPALGLPDLPRGAAGDAAPRHCDQSFERARREPPP